MVNSICSGGSPILTTSSLNVILSGKVSFSGGNAEGGNSTAMSSGNAVGNYTAAMSNGESDGESSTAMSNGVSDGESSTAMSYGSAAGEYSTAMSGAFADGIASTAMSEGYAYADDSTAMSCGYAYGYCSTAMTQGAANGKYSLAAGIDTEADAYSSVSLGSSTHSWGDGNTWIETDPILLVGNGSDDTNRSNAITTLKNGQTTLTNKAWMNRDASVSPTADLSADPAASSGNALVVEGHTVLKGKVIIEQPQGDISMGDYADPGASTEGAAAY